MDYRSALHDAGNYRLTRHEYAYHVNDALWRCKSEGERQQLFMKYLQDCKKRKEQNTSPLAMENFLLYQRLKLSQQKCVKGNGLETRVLANDEFL